MSRDSPDLNEPTDPIIRWLLRGRIKHAQTMSELNRANTERVRTFEGLASASMSLARTLVQVDDLDNVRQTEFERGRMQRTHDLNVLRLEQQIRIEELNGRYQAALAIAAPKPVVQLPPPTQRALPPPPAASPPDEPPRDPRPTPQPLPSLTLEDLKMLLAEMPDLEPSKRDALARMMFGLLAEKKRHGT